MAPLNQDDSEYIESLLDEVRKFSGELKSRQKEQGESVADLSGRIDELAQRLSFFKNNFGVLGEKQFAEGIAEGVQQYILSEVKNERESFVQEIKYHDEQLLKTVRSIPSDLQSSIHNIIDSEMKDRYVRRTVFGWVFGVLGVVACFFIVWNLALPTVDKYKLVKDQEAAIEMQKHYQEELDFRNSAVDFFKKNPNMAEIFKKKYWKTDTSKVEK